MVHVNAVFAYEVNKRQRRCSSPSSEQKLQLQRVLSIRLNRFVERRRLVEGSSSTHPTVLLYSWSVLAAFSRNCIGCSASEQQVSICCKAKHLCLIKSCSCFLISKQSLSKQRPVEGSILILLNCSRAQNLQSQNFEKPKYLSHNFRLDETFMF